MHQHHQRYRLPASMLIALAVLLSSHALAKAHGGGGGGGGGHASSGGHSCGGGHAGGGGSHISCGSSHASCSGVHTSCGGGHITGGHFSLGALASSHATNTFRSHSQSVASTPSSNLNSEVVSQPSNLTTMAEPTDQEQLIKEKHQGLLHHLHGLFSGHTRNVSGELAN